MSKKSRQRSRRSRLDAATKRPERRAKQSTKVIARKGPDELPRAPRATSKPKKPKRATLVGTLEAKPLLQAQRKLNLVPRHAAPIKTRIFHKEVAVPTRVPGTIAKTEKTRGDTVYVSDKRLLDCIRYRQRKKQQEDKRHQIIASGKGGKNTNPQKTAVRRQPEKNPC